MSKTNTIYLYSTKTYTNKGWYKNGQTKVAAKVRVKQQDTTSNPEELILIKSWEVPANITDKKIHKALKVSGYIKTRIDVDREWFVFGTRSHKKACDIIGRHINALVGGVARPDSYEMRDEQQACHDKMIEAHKNGHNTFLVDAKMRFGKCFTEANVLNSLDCKRVLILSGKPAVVSEWKNTFERHVKFANWQFWDAKRFRELGESVYTLPKTGNHVLFASLQDADLSKPKWAIAKKYHYDTIVIDEQHYAGNTERTKGILTALSYDRLDELSGTPFKALLSGEYHDNNTYKWSYIDEQKKKKEEELNGWQTEIYRWLPTMEWHMVEVAAAAKVNSLAYTKEEAFSIPKMFSSDKGTGVFKDEGSVKLCIDDLFGVGVHKNRSPIRSAGCPNHILMYMPSSIASCDAMENLLNKYSKSYGGYHIINASGNSIKDIEVVRDAIGTSGRKGRYEKTITVTCGRFNTGVTIPQWDMAIMLDGGESATSYYQTIFRPQSSDKARKKTKCFVVDYNPQRMVKAIYEYCAYMTSKNQNVQDTLREWLDFSPLLDHTDNKIVPRDINFVLDLIADTGGYIEQFGKASMFNWSVITPDQIILLSKINGESGVTVKKQIIDNDLPKGKNFVTFVRGESKDKKEKDMYRKLRENAITLMKCIPNYIYVDRTQPIESYQDIIKINHGDIFRDATGVTLHDFRNLVENGFIDINHLNRCIMAFRQSLV